MKAKFKAFILTVLALSLLSLSACDRLMPTMGASEYGVIFSALPRFMGGGVRERVLRPGATEFIFPWERLYRIDTSIQSIAWGGVARGDTKLVEDYVETRARDGNEVGLAMTILYHVDSNPETLPQVVQRVGTSQESIHRIVEACARADIRTHMNILRTKDFFSREATDRAVAQVRESLTRRLKSEGIVIDDVIKNDHRFERRLDDGQVDRSYQKQIEQTQATKQETEQEKKKVATVVAQKRQELNEVQAKVNRVVEEAEGQKLQATLRGDSYLAVKTNEAEQIRTVGLAEVESLKKKVAALSGPGGKALLRLKVAQAIIARNPQFVLMNSTSGNGGGLDLTKVDANELIRQVGAASAAAEAVRPTESQIITKPAFESPKSDANLTIKSPNNTASQNSAGQQSGNALQPGQK